MPTARFTPAEIEAFEREALARGGTSTSHVANVPPPSIMGEIVKAKKKPQSPAAAVLTAVYDMAMPHAVMFVPGWLPKSLNKSIGVHWAVKAKSKKAERAIIQAAVTVQKIKPAAGQRRIDLHLVLPPKQRTCDPDNLWKSVLDALVHAKVLVDDNARYREQGAVTFSRGNGGLYGTFILITDR